MRARKIPLPALGAARRMPAALRRWRLAWAVALLAPAALACATGGAPDAADFMMPIDRIAYIDSDGQLATVRPDGTERRVLTRGAIAGAGGRTAGVLAQPALPRERYGWPVWSPDGSRIAVSLITGSSARDAEISVRSLESATGVGGAVFVNEAPLTIADGTPHYVQWSPDGRFLGITAATPEGLTLFVVDANPADGDAGPAAPTPVARGAPLYFHWSPDSAALAVHSGEEVSVVRLNEAATQFAAQPISRSRSFRTPAWSPDGGQLAWSAPGGDGEALWLGRPGEPDYPPLRLTEVEGDCAFSWSPDGQSIAVADRQTGDSPAYRRLRVVAADGSLERTVKAEDWALGFFWEPRGDRLAWVALNAEERTMEWRIASSSGADGEDGDGDDDGDSDDDGDGAVGGLRFSPSGEMFLMLAFFDQYARSHSPWAPDGSGLVAAGVQQYLAERRNGSGAGGARVYVAETAPGGGLRDLAGGGVAVWSTR